MLKTRKEIEKCPECNQMLNYESESKWHDVCPMCGRLTKELLAVPFDDVEN